MTPLMSYRCLPYVTLPSCITDFSMTCSDHIFVRLSHKDKTVNMINCSFYCGISDHLPCFVSIKPDRQYNARGRPLTRLFSETKFAVFVQKMEAQIWIDIYSNTGDCYDKFITAIIHIFQQSFPVVRVSRKRWHDKPWMTAALKASNKSKNSERVLKQAEIKYYDNLLDEHKDSVYIMWKSLNPIINPKKEKRVTVIKKLIINRKESNF